VKLAGFKARNYSIIEQLGCILSQRGAIGNSGVAEVRL
jgi:hypothetical protein